MYLTVFSFADECGQSGGEADSDEDIITDYHIPTLDMLPRPGPLPTISVTPHSPANKTYPVLEDSLQQVRELHESVQRMRDVTIQSKHATLLTAGESYKFIFIQTVRVFHRREISPHLL